MNLPSWITLLVAVSSLFGCGGDSPPVGGTPTPATCGNGVLDANEECDGPEAGRCEELGLGSGQVRCGAGCTFDTRGCSASPITTCGNGRLDEGERCDGALLAGASCEGLGLGSGTLTCNDRCSELDTRGCRATSCVPKTCAELGAACGSVDDGCGATLDCGDACSAQEPWLTCGGGGNQNSCGAVCELPCPEGSTCTPDGVCSYVPVADLALATHQVSFRILLDGQPPTDTAECSNPLSTVGNFLVQNLGLPGGLLQGSVLCNHGWTFGPLALPSGSYEVRVSGRQGATNMPTFTASVIDVPVVADGEVLVNVQSARLRGTLRLDGAAPVETNCSAGELVGVLEFRTPGYQTLQVPVACGGGFAFDAHVLLGTYRVTFRGYGRSNLPSERVIDPALTVAASSDALVLDLADRSTAVTGTLTIGGAAPTTAPGCGPFNEGARVTFLREGMDPFFTNLPCSGPFTYAMSLPPGTYRVWARSMQNSGITQPAFDYRDLPELVVGAAPLVYDIDVPLVQVSGRLTLGGQTPTEDATCSGNAAMLSVGVRGVPVACQSGFTFGPETFVPGSYSVFVSASSSTNLPQSSISALIVPPAGGPVTIDVTPTHTLRVKVTVDGAAPDETSCNGVLAGLDLRSPNVTTGASIACGAGGEASVVLPAGTYRLSTTSPLGGSFPAATYPEAIALNGDTFVEFDITTREVSGQLRLDGALPTETADCVAGQPLAEVLFFDRRSGSTIPVMSTVSCGSAFRYGPVRLALGVYAMYVRPLGNPARSSLPSYQYMSVSRFAVE